MAVNKPRSITFSAFVAYTGNSGEQSTLPALTASALVPVNAALHMSPATTRGHLVPDCCKCFTVASCLAGMTEMLSADATTPVSTLPVTSTVLPPVAWVTSSRRGPSAARTRVRRETVQRERVHVAPIC